MPESKPQPSLQVACPRCQKPSPWHGNAARPFCSERCKLIDLGGWASEEYKIPSTASHDDDPLFD